jgi:hypothetical protein
VERFVWRVVVPVVFSFCVVLTIGAAFDRSRLLAPEGFTTDNVAADLPDSTRVVSVVPGSAAERAGIRVGDLVRYENLSPGQRTLANVGDVRRVVDVRTGDTLTLRLQPDPTAWNTAKHFTFAAVIVLELAGLVILLLRPNLLVARALAAAVILPNVGGISNLAHWTGNEAVAIVTSVFQRFSLVAGIASFGFVALGLSTSIGSKRRILAYAPIALGALVAVVIVERRIQFVMIGTPTGLNLSQKLVNQGLALTVLLGFVSVIAIALQTHGLERRRAVIIAISLVLGNFPVLAGAVYSHFISGPEQILDNVGLLLEAGGLAYAVFVDRLFDIGFVLNRAVVAGAVTALLLPAFVGIEWAAQKLVESSGRVEGALFSLASMIAIALSIRRLHAWVDRAVDGLLFAARHRAANAVKRFADEVALFREPGALVSALLDTLTTFTRVNGCEVLLAEPGDDLIRADARNLSVGRIAADDPVAVRLKSSRTWLERATFPLLMQADLAFPMIVRGRLIGVLLCTLPARAEPLSPEEFDAIAYLTREAGATLVAMDAADAHRLREENLALQARLALRA